MSKKYYERLAKSSGFSEKQFESDFGLKVLKKFGWTEGKGLGKNEDGKEECLQQKRRDGNTGLGNEKKASEEKAPWENWWADCYNNVAKKITDRKQAASSPSPSPSPSAGRKASPAADSDSDSDSDEEPVGGRITAIKSASRMAGKLKRVIRQEAKDPTPTPSKAVVVSKKKAEEKKAKEKKTAEEEKASEEEETETEKQPTKKEKKRKRSAEPEEEEAEQEPEEPSPKKKKKERSSKKKRSESGEEEQNAEATPRSSPERQ